MRLRVVSVRDAPVFYYEQYRNETLPNGILPDRRGIVPFQFRDEQADADARDGGPEVMARW